MHRALALTIALAACGGAPLSQPDGGTEPGVDGGRDRDAMVRPDAGPPGDRFPLSLSTDHNRLIDRNGEPFLIRGDSAWSLMAELSDADVARYLDDRASRGFNTLLVNLIEPAFSSHDPAWRDDAGDVPFTDANDWGTIVEAYWAHVDSVLSAARAHGMLVLLVPAYIGYGCGDEGWCAEMRANGPDRLRAYGQFVGTRYRDVPNILWIEGGDHTPSTSGNPSDRDLVEAVAEGIVDGDGGAHLHAAHWSSGTAGADEPASWLSVDTIYTYDTPSIYLEADRLFARDDGVRPFFLIESSYENEHSTTPLQLRAQMYHPVIGGGIGFLFGNFPIWAFSHPGSPAWFLDDGGYPGGWTTALDSPGAHDATIAGDLLESIRWSDLRPDSAHAVMTAGFGNDGEDDFVLCAATTDGRLAIAYYTALLAPTVDLASFAGPVRARWIDPSSGAETATSGSPFGNSGTHDFAPPGANGDGSNDWVLILDVP